MHPASRENYVEAPSPRPLTRLYYEAEDGWRAPLLHIPACPGGAGEPVVLLHALGFSPDAFRYGSGSTLAQSLSDAGFSVYLLAHRGDAAALAPVRGSFVFDDIIERDWPAALERIREHSGFARVFAVGHGLGGQLTLAAAGRSAAEGLAGVIALCAPVRFAVPRSETLRANLATRLLPSNWRIPARRIAPLLAPWVDAEADLLGRTSPGAAPSARVRGVMLHGMEDVPVGLLRQMTRWFAHGSLVDRTGWFDYREALVDARVPLLVGATRADPTCPAEWAFSAMDTWGGPSEILDLPDSWGHLDPLLARDAEEHCFKPIAAWLTARRRLAWER